MTLIKRIKIAESSEEILRCFPTIYDLRPHLTADDFVKRVRRQQSDARYKLVYLDDEDDVQAVAGFRVSECLAWGKFLYVDDLVTKQGRRSKGYGKALFDWLVKRAREERCDELHLDSGVQRFGAHRFYLLNRMEITCHHFAVKLTD